MAPDNTINNKFNIVPIHKYPELMESCCELINSEWPRNTVARMRTLEKSNDNLPTCLVLTKDDNQCVLAHLKLSPVPSNGKSCFVETVVVDKKYRGQGFGTILMKYAEDYCREKLHLKIIYLSTKGQELFYEKLGYIICPPISLYGQQTVTELVLSTQYKTYMKKTI